MVKLKEWLNFKKYHSKIKIDKIVTDIITDSK